MSAAGVEPGPKATADRPLTIALNAWFGDRAVGSGSYLAGLLLGLRSTAPPGERIVEIEPRRSGTLHKVVFEQAIFPWRARTADVAHIPYWAPPLWSRAPVVVTVHDVIPLRLPEYRRDPRVRGYTRLIVRATRAAARVIVDSEHTGLEVRRHLDVPAGRITVVPLGADERLLAAGRDVLGSGSSVTSPATTGDPPLPDRYGLYLGGFDPRKDLGTLMAAWRTVHRDTGVPLVVAGDVPSTSDHLAESPHDTAGRVGLPEAAWRSIGHVAEADKPALYAGAAVFAFPSRYEGFGLPPLEAMACACPVVAADATSLPEVVGDAGLLVPTGDIEAWALALRRVLERPELARRLAASGHRRAHGYTWAATARATRAVYRAAFDSSRAGAKRG